MAQIKRYANRKLYDSDSGRYVTLEDIAALVRAGEEVAVIDHPSGRDITSLVLLQVVMSEEKRLGDLLPQALLTHLLRAGEERVQPLRARLLAAFAPERQLEEELRQRLARLVERGQFSEAEARRLLDQLLAAGEEEPAPGPDLAELRRQVAELEQQLARLKGE